ncbi:restriction endonuclease [Alicyclobacillus tolerans]|uniref:restriction endonuclease n=1 Tax=Alicyclobacillus tolerans TaxID=90970 RepID=UPI001F295F3C|nr:restriction endonuclease [Alicyclobacillus tolerans]MCF8567930.1 restriction endonuclease [Alicyclobacillus tolerans]
MDDIALYIAVGTVLVFTKVKHWIPIPWQILMIPLVALLLLILYSWRPKRKRRYSKATMNDLDRMSGEEFERALRYYLNHTGWKVQMTPKTNDFGADLLGTAPWGKTYAIQAKRWNQRVGKEAVQQAIGAMHYYNTQAALVITNNFLTKPARELARSAGVELWERGKLQRLMATVKGGSGNDRYF